MNYKERGLLLMKYYSNMQESIDQYKDYVNTHIRNVKVAYNKYADVLKDVLGINKKELLERVLNHDKSKWSADEFEGYRQKFYPVEGEEPNEDIFDKSWFHHLKNNDHHPEYWTYVDDNNKDKILDMPDICIAEMILDWATFSILKQDDNEFIEYYKNNRYNKPFSNNTRDKLDKVMKEIIEGNVSWV